MAAVYDLWHSTYSPQIATTGLGNNEYLSDLNGLYGNIVSSQQQVWDREDSAYQRMVADMKKAGLNPWSAISSGGLTTSSTSPQLAGLTSLISALGLNTDVGDLTRKQGKDMMSNLFTLLKGLSGVVKLF